MREIFIIVNFLLFGCIPFLALLWFLSCFSKIMRKKYRNTKNIIGVVMSILVLLLILVFWILVNFQKPDVNRTSLNNLSNLNLQQINCSELNDLFDEAVYVELEKNDSVYYNECLNKISKNKISLLEKLFGCFIQNENTIIIISPMESSFRFDSNVFDLCFSGEIEILNENYILTIQVSGISNYDEIIQKIIAQTNY